MKVKKPTIKFATASRSAGMTTGPIAGPDDGFLGSDSEEDEFAAGPSRSIFHKHNEEPFVDDKDEDLDELGVVAWEPDSWDAGVDSGSESASSSESSPDNLKLVQNGLGSLPFSTIIKAQRNLRATRDGSDSSHGSDHESTRTSRDRVSQVKAKLAEMQQRKGKAVRLPHKVEEAETPEAAERETLGREHKHAPTTMSSKKQVSRLRKVIETPKSERRDPRFSSVSGGVVDAYLHHKSYGFVPNLLRTELSALKQAVSLASKAERTCPLSEKESRIAEREQLEQDLGRMRTRLERTEREMREREVLAVAKKTENEKRKQGKGAWYMKNGEKRDLLIKAKFENLDAKGGTTAVKKAIEKKRKKIAGKEKKSRPFARGEGSGRMEEGSKRRRIE